MKPDNMHPVSFRELRKANVQRLPLFRRVKSGPRPHHDVSDWTLSDWCTATAGELGEAANIIKKIRRGDFTLNAAREALAAELADTVTYLDILADAAGIDLGQAVVRKFNKVSDEADLEVYL